MRNIFRIIFLSMIVLLTGCNGKIPESETKTSDTGMESSQLMEEQSRVQLKEVVFLNSYEAMMRPDEVQTKNEIWTGYPSVEEEKLYAFFAGHDLTVEIEPQREGETDIEYKVRCDKTRGEATVQAALELGLMVMYEHPYCRYQNSNLERYWEEKYQEGGSMHPLLGNCVVVGTMEQIVELFGKTETTMGSIWSLEAAVRPDIVDIIKEVGLTEKEIEHFYVGIKVRQEAFEKIIGTEPQVTLTVPVILPEEIAE